MPSPDQKNNVESVGIYDYHRDTEGDYVVPLKDKKQRNDNINIVKFDLSTRDIVDAIICNDEIGGINIVQAIQNPNFRFKSTIEPELSIAVSEAMAVTLNKLRSNVGKIGSANSVKKRIHKADEYASKMHKVLEEIKSKKEKITLRAIADELTTKGFSPPQGDKWHANTVRSLQKRIATLGLSS
jgi:hypothetical protein